MNQAQQAERFRTLHRRRPLVLPNAWDAASARVIELAGAPAIATTSAGIAWTFGRPDGQRLSREEMLHVIRLIVAAVAETIRGVISTGGGRKPGGLSRRA